MYWTAGKPNSLTGGHLHINLLASNKGTNLAVIATAEIHDLEVEQIYRKGSLKLLPFPPTSSEIVIL